MAVYEYQAISRTTGKRVKGVIDADSPAAARRKLRDQEMVPTALAESFGAAQAGPGGGGRKSLLGRIPARDVAIMTRQLAVLLQAGMPLVEGLGALIDQTPNARLKEIVYDVRGRVNEGQRLAAALSQHKRVFSELYINMVGAGEASGALEQVLFRLADIQERNVKLTHRIRSTMLYPLFMAAVGLGVVSFLMLFIVPQITQMFEQQNRELPLITLMLIGSVRFTKQWWPIMVAVGVVVVLSWRYWVSRPAGRLQWDTLKLKLPLYKAVYIRLLSSRFARTLGTMLSSGLTMLNGLEVVKSVLQNRRLEQGMEDVKAGVRRGVDLSAPMREMGVWPPMMLSMIELGQRSGELDNMLLKVADTYEDEVEVTVETMVNLLEPVMIVVMAAIVGFLVVAMLLPILTMSSGI